MDIHRSRFVPFPASAINAVSFSRTSDKNVPDPKPALKLAIGRADGSIEIWNPDKGNWVQEVVFPGGEERSVEGLVWTQDPNDTDAAGKPIVGQLRLFSIGATASVTEWNLQTGKSLRVSTGNFSEVWCFAAQPRSKPSKDGDAATEQWTGQDLVAGCGDGTLAILTTADDDLTFKKFLARSGSRKTRCMSVVWQGRDKVVAGFSDSTIRVYDVRNGSLLRTMSLGAGIPGAPKDTLVWKVKCLPTGDIVSADSNGEVRFWDGRTYSMMQRVSGHDSDCLDLVTSSDGQTVISGGIDGKIAVYKLTSRDNEKRRWAKTSHRRMHQGDVKSMAVYDSKQMSVVVTGGLDTEPNVVPLREMNKENHRRLPGLPQSQPCVSAPRARLLASWWDREVSIWRIAKQDSIAFVPDAKSKQLVMKVILQGTEHIQNAAISNDGRLLAVSTSAATKLFQLRPSKQQDNTRLRASSIVLPSDISKEGSRLLSISPDSKWLVTINLENEIKVSRIQPSTSDPKHLEVLPEPAELEREHRKSISQTGLKTYDQTINHIAFSSDSLHLAISDITGHLDTFHLTGTYDPTAPASVRVQPTRKSKPIRASSPSSSDSDSDSEDDDLPLTFSNQTWHPNPSSQKLPKLDSTPLLLSFQPSTSLLLVLTQHHHLFEFEVGSGKLSAWSRRNPSSVLPPELLGIKERVMGVIWDQAGALPGGKEGRECRAWLFGASWLAMLDLRAEFGTSSASTDSKGEKNELTSTGTGKEVVLSNGAKRKWTEEEKWEHRAAERKRRKGKSGAGDRVREAEMNGLALGGTLRDAEGEDLTDTRMDVDGLESEDEEEGALVPLRREGSSDDQDLEQVGDSKGASSNASVAVGRRWWCTFKYRPILGLVAFEREEGVDVTEMNGIEEDGVVAEKKEKETAPLEVVLVERPSWDLEQLRK